MAAKKAGAKPKTAPAPKTPNPEPPKSVTGVELIDGRPFFAVLNGERVNRQQWIDATRPARKAQLVADLRAETERLADEAKSSNDDQ